MERLATQGHEIRVIDFEIRWRSHNKKGLLSPRMVVREYHKLPLEGGVTVIRPPFVRLPVADYCSILLTHWREIAGELATFSPDIVIGFGILNTAIAFHLARKAGVPTIYYIIDELHRLVPQPSLQALARRIESRNMRSADCVLSINEALRAYTHAMGADPGKTAVIRAGIDLEVFGRGDRDHIRSKHDIVDEDIVLFFMGWLYDFSGLREVALELGAHQDPHLKMLVLGKGDLHQELTAIRDRNGLGRRLILVDWVPYPEVPDYIAAADICILPAHANEIMQNIVPIKLYEYLAAGRPVIATRLPGVLLEFGTDGGLVYVDRPEDVRTTALELAGNRRLTEIGIRARETVAEQGWDRMTALFSSLLEDLAAGRWNGDGDAPSPRGSVQ
jgi:glycosyltransferase involved in cell wall biosynthesis